MASTGGALDAWNRLLRWLWSDRVEVSDRSMVPTLLPGDRLRVDTRAYRTRRPQPGDLVVLHDPEEPSRWLVKRVGRLDRASDVSGTETASLTSDNPGPARDSRQFGDVPVSSIVGKVYLRYAPPERVGPL